MISSIFDKLGGIISAFVDMLVTLFQNVVKIFYTTGTSGATGELTIVGELALVGLGTGLVIWAFHYVRSLIRVKTK